MQLILERFMHGHTVTFGSIDVGSMTLYTLEEPWRNNARGESCIPQGVYQLRPIIRPNGKMAIAVVSVPGRDNILIHVGNTTDDTEGCILPGLGYGFEPRPHVRESQTAFEILHNIVSANGRDATLWVRLYNPYQSNS